MRRGIGKWTRWEGQIGRAGGSEDVKGGRGGKNRTFGSWSGSLCPHRSLQSGRNDLLR